MLTFNSKAASVCNIVNFSALKCSSACTVDYTCSISVIINNQSNHAMETENQKKSKILKL